MKKYLGLFVGLALVLPMAAGAAEFRSGQVVNSNETVKDNLYVGGGTVNIAGTVEGDLYVGGGTVTIMGTVTKDVVVSGGTVIITGKIGEDLRVGGGNITIGGSVGGELLAGGGTVNILPGVAITKSAYIGGGNINLGGSVGGNLVIGSENIVLGEGAKIAGNFDYYAQKEMNFGAAKISGKTTFHEQVVKRGATAAKKFPWFAFITFWAVVGLAGAIILACLLLYLWPKDSREMISKAFAQPGKELIRGFVLMFIIPIAAIICLITLVGLPIAVMVGSAYAVLTILAAAMSGLLGAALMAKFIFKKKETEINWWLIALALLILALIKLIPIVGWILAMLVYWVALGVMGNKLYEKLSPEK